MARQIFLQDVSGFEMFEDGCRMIEPVTRAEVKRPTSIVSIDARIRVAPRFIIGCPSPGCRYTASAQLEGQAVQNLVAHLIAAHKRANG